MLAGGDDGFRLNQALVVATFGGDGDDRLFAEHLRLGVLGWDNRVSVTEQPREPCNLRVG